MNSGTKNELGMEIKPRDKDYIKIPGVLYELKNIPGDIKINNIHIEFLCKIYGWMQAPKEKNQYGACRKSNDYFANYFLLSKREVCRILQALESYGFIIRSEKKLAWDDTNERYIWVNCKLINRILMKKIFDERFTVPSWAIENAVKNGWKEIIDTIVKDEEDEELWD